ncbi:hypothetical protein L1887_28062 [Cichorium endivia]|nr:hypothetical protein L1887_28062 [Cichorium endivia]
MRRIIKGISYDSLRRNSYLYNTNSKYTISAPSLLSYNFLKLFTLFPIIFQPSKSCLSQKCLKTFGYH